MEDTIVYLFSLADIALGYISPFIIGYIVVGMPVIFIINLIRGE